MSATKLTNVTSPNRFEFGNKSFLKLYGNLSESVARIIRNRFDSDIKIQTVNKQNASGSTIRILQRARVFVHKNENDSQT